MNTMTLTNLQSLLSVLKMKQRNGKTNRYEDERILTIEIILSRYL